MTKGKARRSNLADGIGRADPAPTFAIYPLTVIEALSRNLHGKRAGNRLRIKAAMTVRGEQGTLSGFGRHPRIHRIYSFVDYFFIGMGGVLN
jgi:hypothetical protein